MFSLKAVDITLQYANLYVVAIFRIVYDIYIYKYIYKHTHTHTHTYIYIYIYIYIYSNQGKN